MKSQITISKADKNKNWQELLRLENSFLLEIGEQPLTQAHQTRLAQAVRDERITFFLASHGNQAVGMCSVAKHFSTYACTDIGVFDDFYVAPGFRKKGIARKLSQAAQSWSCGQGLSGLTVCCAPCDEQMYQSLGFNTPIGKTFVMATPSD